MIDAGLLNNCS